MSRVARSCKQVQGACTLRMWTWVDVTSGMERQGGRGRATVSGLELRGQGKVAAASAVLTKKEQLLLQNTAAAAASSDIVTAAAAAATAAAAAAPLLAEMHVIDGTPVHTFVKATYSIEVRCPGQGCMAHCNVDLLTFAYTFAPVILILGPTCEFTLASPSTPPFPGNRRQTPRPLRWTRWPRFCPRGKQAAPNNVRTG